MQIKITVSGPDGIAHAIDLEQESEGFWLDFLTEMRNAGHGADTICRTIAERIKGTVQPVLTRGPVDNAADAAKAVERAQLIAILTDIRSNVDELAGFLDDVDEALAKADADAEPAAAR